MMEDINMFSESRIYGLTHDDSATKEIDTLIGEIKALQESIESKTGVLEFLKVFTRNLYSQYQDGNINLNPILENQMEIAIEFLDRIEDEDSYADQT